MKVRELLRKPYIENLLCMHVYITNINCHDDDNLPPREHEIESIILSFRCLCDEELKPVLKDFTICQISYDDKEHQVDLILNSKYNKHESDEN